MRERWLSRRAILAHVGLLVYAPGCALACWWQATRALGGNTLSWLYAVEWPGLAVFGAVVWWYLIHDDPDSVGERGLRRAVAARQAQGAPPPPETVIRPVSDEEDPELAAYNRYLAGLAASGRRKSWRAG